MRVARAFQGSIPLAYATPIVGAAVAVRVLAEERVGRGSGLGSSV
jgi:hypothetical protein